MIGVAVAVACCRRFRQRPPVRVRGRLYDSGPCGAFDFTWTEVPASIGGSIATRGDTQQTLPGGVTNGNSLNVGGVPTGTALNYSSDTSLGASLIEQTNVTVTITSP